MLFLSAPVKLCSHVDEGVSITSVKKGIKNAGGAAKLGRCQVSENLGWGGGVISFCSSKTMQPCRYISITSVKKGIKNAGGAAKLGRCQVSENLGWGGGVISFCSSKTMQPCRYISITSVKKGIKNAGGAAKLRQCQVRLLIDFECELSLKRYK